MRGAYRTRCVRLEGTGMGRRYNVEGQLELFAIAANTSDIRAKNVRELMTWSTFNISSRHKQSIKHEFGDKFLNVATSGKSIATWHDNDLLIFLTSHLVSSINAGEKTSPRIFFSGHEFFNFARRGHIGGTRYTQIWDTLVRLHETSIHTNIDLANGDRLESRWNWLPEIHRKTTRTGKAIGFEVLLADPVYRAINQSTPQVLTLDDRYFDFRSGFDKFLYMFARRSAGHDREWLVTEKLLHERSGSTLPITQWRKLLVDTIEAGELADYKIKKAMIGRDKAVAFERSKYAIKKVHKATITIE